MFENIKESLRKFKLKMYVKSALKAGIIDKDNDGEYGIIELILVDYMEVMPKEIKDDFINEIYNIVIQKRMEAELNEKAMKDYREKIKNFIIYKPIRPIGHILYP